MRIFFILFISFVVCTRAKAGLKDSTIYYNLPDSVKAVQFMAEIKVTDINSDKKFVAGISTQIGSLYLLNNKGKRGVLFQTHDRSISITTGNGIRNSRLGNIRFDFDWKPDKSYKLLLSMASDSADKICLVSAYIFLPEEGKWKFITTQKHPFPETKFKGPLAILKSSKKSTGNINIGEVWCQRSNGSWKNLKDETLPPPVINLFGHVDSVQQRQKDIKQIEDSITAGKTNAKQNEQGVYYEILKQGTGRQVTVNDTVTVHYKGSLFSDGTVFDQTKDKPATFPLKRLIRGWQVGVPLLKVGGKIKLIILSDMAYSIRTRSAKIPPNSILVFEIEVVDVKPAL
jgi:FKBP-type peptidyl-prolyl cis-trans isomerase FkpA